VNLVIPNLTNEQIAYLQSTFQGTQPQPNPTPGPTPTPTPTFPKTASDGTKLVQGPTLDYTGVAREFTVPQGQTVALAFTAPASGQFRVQLYGKTGGDNIPRCVWFSKTPGFVDWQADARGGLPNGFFENSQAGSGSFSVITYAVVDSQSGLERTPTVTKLHTKAGELWYAMVQNKDSKQRFATSAIAIAFDAQPVSG
jgi:hypothetical protein